MSARLPDAGLDAVFHALGDPGRRQMIERLCQGPASVSELAKPLAMTLSAVVQHLQVLETSGLVHTQKEGRTRTCRLESHVLHSAESWIAGRRNQWQSRFDRLGNFLAEQEAPSTPHQIKSRTKRPT